MAPSSFQAGGNAGHSCQESRWSCGCMTYITALTDSSTVIVNTIIVNLTSSSVSGVSL